ncbi:pyridoxamine 5'-phosphate oxidase family protein [Shimia sp. CNT1-13L.2]|uniref:HugZ family pyridoxamine 5'-phosphate oxidase n=1 Tax=Shimia sp. CNT1-13L.2 TaxID=2959663 RepID=UPI0020CC7856|nr:pyridoxamine 5'-phosphate oxidase family protein [Shimia sp. CNT1-13L.2]MCP9480338.1 pyridoxamine 5'-phosphate oxidase family protein [Shimia sp. CNT1-13L.2]
MTAPKDPFQPLDDDARALARQLISGATYGALAVLDPASGAPSVTRIAIGTDLDGTPVTLISSLSSHTAALRADPRCSLLLGEPGPKGDPLTHPRLTLECTATFLPRDTSHHPVLRDHYLQTHPKAKLYIDFADFTFVRFTLTRALLNAGFGKAFKFDEGDLGGA